MKSSSRANVNTFKYRLIYLLQKSLLVDGVLAVDSNKVVKSIGYCQVNWLFLIMSTVLSYIKEKYISKVT